jgi:hypothetical protein
VRFEPRDARFAKLYLELRPERAELRRDSAQDYAVLQGSDVVFRFQFTKMCLTCTPGTPAPSSVVPALMDEEFGLLDKTIRHFYSGWKEIYRLSSGPRPESDSKEPGGTATSTGSRSGPVDSAPGATQPSRCYLSGYGRVDTEESAVTRAQGEERLKSLRRRPRVRAPNLQPCDIGYFTAVQSHVAVHTGNKSSGADDILIIHGHDLSLRHILRNIEPERIFCQAELEIFTV